MIDEKNIIEKIRNYRDYFIDGWKNYEDDFDKARADVCDTVLKIINEQPKICKWVSCEERLPENNSLVLVRYSYNSFFDNMVEIAYYSNNTWTMRGNTAGNKILEWFMIPQPWIKEIEYEGDKK